MKIVVALVFLLVHTSQSSRIKRQLSVGDDCTTSEKGKGKCIMTRDCSWLQAVLNQGTEESLAYFNKFHCGFEGREGLVCCPMTTTTTGRTTDTNECGQSMKYTDRVVNGTVAKLGFWPWMAVLGYHVFPDQSISWNCGGTLVTDRHVVTAAHCVILPRHYKLEVVRLGELNLDDGFKDGASPVDFDVDSWKAHPQYNSRTKVNDIAIIKIKGQAQFSSLLRPICIPEFNQFQSLTERSAFVAGWGDLEYGGNSSNALMHAEVTVVSEESCRYAYSKYSVVIDERVVCTFKPRVDACQGDSGGPLMLEENDKFFLVGVISYGKDCATMKFPGVYTRATSFLDFINNNIQ